MFKFPCTSCGCCCKRVRSIINGVNNDNVHNLLRFPYTCNDDGVCEKLTSDNKCSVYDIRPLCCRIEEATHILNWDVKASYLMNAKVCNSMMDEDNIPANFRIDLKLIEDEFS